MRFEGSIPFKSTKTKSTQSGAFLFWLGSRGIGRERCKKACRGNCGAAPPGADEAAPQFPQPRRFASLSLYGEVRKRHCGKAVVRAGAARGRKRRHSISAAVEKPEGMRKPERFFGHRKVESEPRRRPLTQRRSIPFKSTKKDSTHRVLSFFGARRMIELCPHTPLCVCIRQCAHCRMP